ncbi:tyrosine-type recombinase/integrase [Janthinobacterium sp. 13]|uniref:tyrosine-type recombinase/integrase n=1 Tax=Janthinobacterium sp. 13 TaxID=2035211 RepID=UPI00211DEB51|nr:tyrosine-type recombinase/integrase [Janthinobacterium sp. 13]
MQDRRWPADPLVRHHHAVGVAQERRAGEAGAHDHDQQNHGEHPERTAQGTGRRDRGRADRSQSLARWCYSKVEAPLSRDDIDPLTKEEQSAILAQTSGQGRNLLQFAFWTGMRTSELVALDWADVDFVRGVVMVTRALTQHSKAAESTKTNAGRREVKLLARAMHALQEQKSFTWEKGGESFKIRVWSGAGRVTSRSARHYGPAFCKTLACGIATLIKLGIPMPA